MTVVDHYGDNEQLLAESFALCTDAILPRGKTISEGDPTQTAVVDYAAKLGLPKYDLEAKAPRVGEIPFDSGRKMMTTVHKTGDGYIQHTTGAPDVVISRCTHILADGKVIPLTDDLRVELAEANKRFADRALRVLAAAFQAVKADKGQFTVFLIAVGFAQLFSRGRNIQNIIYNLEHQTNAVGVFFNEG